MVCVITYITFRLKCIQNGLTNVEFSKMCPAALNKIILQVKEKQKLKYQADRVQYV